MRNFINFNYHPVGQGFFGSARLLNTYLVYDCGSDNKCTLASEVSQFYPNTIHALVISHFDEDHINGLELLLSKCNVQNVFIPYLTPYERLILTLLNPAPSKEYCQFLKNPTLYLKDKGVTKTFVISHGEQGENNTNPISNFDITDSQINTSKLQTDDELKSKIETEEPSFLNASVSVCNDFEFVYLPSKWFIKFFNKPLAQAVHNKIRANLKSVGITNSQQALDAIGDTTQRDQLKRAYKLTWKKLNQTSLVVLCSSLNTYYHRIFPSLPVYYPSSNFLWEDILRFHRYPLLKAPVPGNLFCGDINFDQTTLQDFQSHYACLLEQVLTSALPHHGSEKNWNEELLNLLPNCKYWIASAGMVNKHKHPSYDVAKSVISANREYYHISESKGFIYSAFCRDA